jgi:hypothetical protein
MPPDRLLEVIRRKRLDVLDRDIVAYWYRVLTDRSDYAAKLRQLAAGLPVVPMVVRGGFANYNSVMSDLRQLVLDHRHHFEPPTFPALPVQRPVTLVLLSKTPFELPETESPTALPDWFPMRGGEIIKVKIEDLCWRALVPLDAEEVRCGELCDRLFALESNLVQRWRAARLRDRNAGDIFFTSISPIPSSPFSAASPRPTADDFLCQAEKYHGSLTDSTGFRPSAKANTPSLIGRLFRLASQTSRDDLLSRVRELAAALALPPDRQAPRDSLVTVLSRSTNSVPEQPLRFARNLILTAYAASQFVNAKAHKDTTPEFPLVLLQGLSLDLRETLAELTHCLGTWPMKV